MAWKVPGKLPAGLIRHNSVGKLYEKWSECQSADVGIRNSSMYMEIF